ncbi:MAG: ABC transporter substrate-binding protein [Lachnospiraceae bacterium]|nr:ABC transporter substrate-binding protein [Lachnospiraceae bacterium]
MKKRIVAVMMAVLMGISAFAGCGKGNSSDQAKGTNQEGNKEPETVKWLLFGTEPEDHDMVMEELNKLLVEKINVKLDLEWIAESEYETRVKLAVSSGEDFDLLWVSNWMNQFNEYVAEEALMPLNDLIEEYGQGIDETLEDWVLNFGTVGDTIYAIPCLQILANQRCVMVQKDLVEKYNLDTSPVEDYRDLEGILEIIKQNEPDIIPMRANVKPEVTHYESLVAAEIWISMTDSSATPIEDDSVTWEAAKLKREWFDKGYIREDVATITDDSGDAKAGRYAVMTEAYKPGIEAAMADAYGIECVAIPIGNPYVSATAGQATMIAMNVNSERPEAAMKLFNCVYTDEEVFNMLLFGIENVHYKKVADNRAEFVENTKYSMSSKAWEIGNQFLAWYIPGQADGTWEETDQMNKNSIVSPLQGFIFDSTGVQAELAQIAAVITEYENYMYTAEDLEKTHKEYFEKLKTAGRDTVLEELKKQIEEWKAGK